MKKLLKRIKENRESGKEAAKAYRDFMKTKQFIGFWLAWLLIVIFWSMVESGFIKIDLILAGIIIGAVTAFLITWESKEQEKFMNKKGFSLDSKRKDRKIEYKQVKINYKDDEL